MPKDVAKAVDADGTGGGAPISSSRLTPVALAVASLTSVILPSAEMVTNGSRLASIRLRAYWEA